MCVIVDTNVASLVFGSPSDSEYQPVIDWLNSKTQNGRIVYGGKLAKELVSYEKSSLYFRQLILSSRAIRIPDAEVDFEEAKVKQTGICRSDDPHVIALARVSGARTLCANDRNLHADFTNPKLLSKPRGKVYQNSRHAHLLKHTSGCLFKRGK